jgi:hypothetical protein
MNMQRETYMMMKNKTKYTTSFWRTSLNEKSQNLPININVDVTCVGSQIGLVDPNYWIHDVGDYLGNAILSHEQMHIFNIICSKTNGLHVILGT